MFIWIEDMFAITMCLQVWYCCAGKFGVWFFSIFSSDSKDLLTTGRIDQVKHPTIYSVLVDVSYANWQSGWNCS